MGYPLRNRLIVFDKSSSTAYLWNNDIDKIKGIMRYRAKYKPEQIFSVINKYAREMRSMTNYLKKVANKKITSLPNEELINILLNYLEKLYRCNYGPMAWMVDKSITPLITDYLKNKITNEDRFKEAMRVLLISDVKSILLKEKKAFLELALVAWETKELRAEVNNKRGFILLSKKILAHPKLHQLLKKHHQAFCWIPVYWSLDEPYSLNHFAKSLASLMNERNPNETRRDLKELKSISRTLRDKRTKLLRQAKLPKLIERYACIVREFSRIKTIHPDDLSYTQYLLLNIYKEIARRAKMPFDDFRYLTIDEILNFLKIKKLLRKKQIMTRKSFCILLLRDGSMSISEGQNARKVYKQELKIVKEKKQSILRGFPASQGVVKGKVTIITKLTDLRKMKAGNILVASQTNPNYLVAMKKAAAFVTDEGGITSHAAIVSRELGIPCVIGTKIATQVLKDGDFVEVDADKGIVRKIK